MATSSNVNSFFAGVFFTLIIIILGAIVVVYTVPEAKAAENQPIKLERQFLFKVLAPKGYEDVGYLQFDCKPMIHKSKTKMGMK